MHGPIFWMTEWWPGWTPTIRITFSDVKPSQVLSFFLIFASDFVLVKAPLRAHINFTTSISTGPNVFQCVYMINRGFKKPCLSYDGHRGHRKRMIKWIKMNFHQQLHNYPSQNSTLGAGWLIAVPGWYWVVVVVVHMFVSPTADLRTSQVIAINELLALGFANLGGAICGAVPTQPLVCQETLRVGKMTGRYIACISHAS